MSTCKKPDIQGALNSLEITSGQFIYGKYQVSPKGKRRQAIFGLLVTSAYTLINIFLLIPDESRWCVYLGDYNSFYGGKRQFMFVPGEVWWGLVFYYSKLF